MSETVTLADIERLAWHVTGWDAEQWAVDELLDAIRTHMGCGCSGVAASLGSGGAGEETPVSVPERPAAPLAPLAGTPEPPEAVNGAQGGVRRIEIMGTLTLVCSHGQTAAVAPAASRPGVAEVEGRPDLRRCTTCNLVQGRDQFHRKSKTRATLRTQCMSCDRKRKRARTAAKRGQQTQAA